MMTRGEQLNAVWDMLVEKPGEQLVTWNKLTCATQVFDSVMALQHSLAPDARDVYVHLNPTIKRWLCRDRRPKAHDFAGYRVILIDVDPKETGSESFPCKTVHDLLAEDGISIRDVAQIYSGRGYQFWIRVSPMLPAHERIEGYAVSELVKLWLKSLANRFDAREWKIDSGVGDVGRLARMPMTVNSKTNRIAELDLEWSICKATDMRAVLAKVAREHAVACAVEKIDGKAQKVAPDFAGAPLMTKPWQKPWQTYIPRISGYSADFLLLGYSPRGRNNAAYQAMLELLEAGAHRLMAQDLVMRAGLRTGLSSHEINRTIQSALEKWETRKNALDSPPASC